MHADEHRLKAGSIPFALRSVLYIPEKYPRFARESAGMKSPRQKVRPTIQFPNLLS